MNICFAWTRPIPPFTSILWMICLISLTAWILDFISRFTELWWCIRRASTRLSEAYITTLTLWTKVCRVSSPGKIQFEFFSLNFFSSHFFKNKILCSFQCKSLGFWWWKNRDCWPRPNTTFPLQIGQATLHWVQQFCVYDPQKVWI